MVTSNKILPVLKLAKMVLLEIKIQILVIIAIIVAPHAARKIVA